VCGCLCDEVDLCYGVSSSSASVRSKVLKLLLTSVVFCYNNFLDVGRDVVRVVSVSGVINFRLEHVVMTSFVVV